MSQYRYVIVGGGQAAASAVEGIRARDAQGSILLLASEPEPPYQRPPLSKQLWAPNQSLDQIYPHPEAFYAEQKVELKRGTAAAAIDAKAHTVRDASGASHTYQKLLLATGGTPRRLPIPGGELPGISYFRTVADYHALRGATGAGKTAVIIGGGFIGSEIAAALTNQQVAVTMVFPEQWLVSRVFPEALGRALTAAYRSKGVRMLTGDVPTAIEKGPNGQGYVVRTRNAAALECDIVVVGIGINPNIELAQAAGLATGNGVIVNEYLQTSDPDIYAAGDVAYFPEVVLGPRRIEHWDAAASHGQHAGGNMAATAGEARGGGAGANAKFEAMPMFFSDLFEFGYEAVGEVDSRLETYADWQEEYKTGVVYYLGEGRLRGAMMCNVWGKVDEARALIRKAEPVPDGASRLKGAIAFA